MFLQEGVPNLVVMPPYTSRFRFARSRGIVGSLGGYSKFQQMADDHP